jgi:hypothetical protein
MTKYDHQEEGLLTPDQAYELTKTARLWAYLQSKFEIDLETFTNALLKCEKAGKVEWTDKELIMVAVRLRDAQNDMDYKEIAHSIIMSIT